MSQYDLNNEHRTLAYPNSTTDGIVIHIPPSATGWMRLRVYDAYGTPIINKPMDNSDTAIRVDLRTLASGVYLAKLDLARKRMTALVVKQERRTRTLCIRLRIFFVWTSLFVYTATP